MYNPIHSRKKFKAQTQQNTVLNLFFIHFQQSMFLICTAVREGESSGTLEEDRVKIFRSKY